MLTSEIMVRARFVGFHQWADAPAERSYLAVAHRHEFHVEVCADVSHNDRQIEFHDLGDELRGLLPDHGEDLGGASCEMMAAELFVGLEALHPGAIRWIEVWEDGECGARVTRS